MTSSSDETWAVDHFIALDHVQVAMPAGEEAKARAFYMRVLGMRELTKPANLAGRGGCWFAGGEGAAVQIHLGVEPGFRPAKKAHPAILVTDVEGLAERIAGAGYEVRWDDELEGTPRFFCDDPFGNRLEFIGAFEE